MFVRHEARFAFDMSLVANTLPSWKSRFGTASIVSLTALGASLLDWKLGTDKALPFVLGVSISLWLGLRLMDVVCRREGVEESGLFVERVGE